jgi:hypothetical protein
MLFLAGRAMDRGLDLGVHPALGKAFPVPLLTRDPKSGPRSVVDGSCRLGRRRDADDRVRHRAMVSCWSPLRSWVDHSVVHGRDPRGRRRGLGHRQE